MEVETIKSLLQPLVAKHYELGIKISAIRNQFVNEFHLQL